MYLNEVFSSFYQDGLHLLRWRGGGLRGSRGRSRSRGLSCQNDFLLPSSLSLSWNGRSSCRLRDDLSPAHLAGRHVERQREPARQLHDVCGSVARLARLRGRFQGDSLLRRDCSGGSGGGWYGHWSGDDGVIGAWYELDLAWLGHHLYSLGALDLRHHLVLDVGRCRSVGAGRALLDGEHDGAARGGGAQTGRELDHIAFG